MNLIDFVKDVLNQTSVPYQLFKDGLVDVSIKIEYSRTNIKVHIKSLDFTFEETYKEIPLLDSLDNFVMEQLEEVNKHEPSITLKNVFQGVLVNGNHGSIFSSWYEGATIFTDTLVILSEKKNDMLMLKLVNKYRGGIRTYHKGNLKFK